VFPDLDNTSTHYEDSAPTYFFGDTFSTAGARYDFFAQTHGVARVTTAVPKITWGSHLDLAAQSGVVVALFGAGVGDSTDGVGSPATDGNWWITKVQKYYEHPIALDGSSTPTPTPTPSPSPTPKPSPSPTPTATPTPTPTSAKPVTITYRITNSWDSGMEVALSVKNTGKTTVTSWAFEFDYPATISSLWNGALSSKLASGSTHKYRITPAAWNTQIAPGQTLDLGFIAAPGNTAATLQNLTIEANGTAYTP
jgi:cellulase/cellobiase CelA1